MTRREYDDWRAAPDQLLASRVLEEVGELVGRCRIHPRISALRETFFFIAIDARATYRGVAARNVGTTRF